jgi:hypothetical protein
MRDKIVDGHFDAFEMLKPLERFSQKFEIECVRVVEIVIVTGRLVVLFLCQHFIKGILA